MTLETSIAHWKHTIVVIHYKVNKNFAILIYSNMYTKHTNTLIMHGWALCVKRMKRRKKINKKTKTCHYHHFTCFVREKKNMCTSSDAALQSRNHHSSYTESQPNANIQFHEYRKRMKWNRKNRENNFYLKETEVELTSIV